MAQLLPILVVGHVLVSARHAARGSDTGLPAALAGLAVVGVAIGAGAEATVLWVLHYERAPADVFELMIPVAAGVNFVALILGAALAYMGPQRGP